MIYQSRVVNIGSLPLGGSHPIRLQSMTNTNTLDTRSTVEQAIRMIEAGSELVRITAPGPKEATNLGVIKAELKKRGFEVPLIADIHFNPEAAEIAARLVEKVRINPGNYTDRPSPGKTHWSEQEYQQELEHIAVKLTPLLGICRNYGTAIRIGVNHGSLSQRILSRYGDTAEGMVQSALEFTRICHQQGFHNLVLSLKSSNVRVMVEACRQLAEQLTLEGLNYPLHLGVTEAGDGEDGRLKSVSGIGALLARGIGDTIRVSLTEAPEAELPVARAIVSRFHQNLPDGTITRKIRPDLSVNEEISGIRETVTSGPLGGKNPVAVLLKQGNQLLLAGEKGDFTPLPHRLVQAGRPLPDGPQPLMIHADEAYLNAHMPALTETLANDKTIVLLAEAGTTRLRRLANALQRRNLENPLILKSPVVATSPEDLIAEISLNPGNLLIDGAGDGLCLEAKGLSTETLTTAGFGLLQATRRRISRTEYIACPSCGRTLFHIEETLQQIKARTAHLKGLKIGVMGCIVNGPGEMADADYGYVGSGKGKVTLYKGKTPIKRGIPEKEAVEALIALIKEGGDWKEV
ncbi:MAG: (E)-4-hydroxy-3-methylbut-2-enyl-diphosphate synthase [Lentimicrobium sp.]|nr:(E)-4-hydroxy-3-methylbut-2-enyl-diphosphate synthase [Lentimicrobium sp.]